MTEKNLQISTLLDYYAPVLGEKTRLAVEYYYNDDLSLAEIAEIMSMTRQGARSLIKSGEEKLLELEQALGLEKKLSEVNRLCDMLLLSCKGNSKAESIIREIYNQIQ